jgi:[ribosomal protein S5]-alanine N-acetyltransferase
MIIKMLELNFSPFPEITTERLLLRRIAMDDADEIFMLRSSEGVMKYVDRKRATSIEEARAFITAMNESLDSNNGVMWAITFRDEPAVLLGYIGFWRLIKQNYRAEVGYMLNPKFWKKGIMKEALLRVIDFGFEEMKLHSIEANINPDNEASAKILESTGFIKEAYFKEDFFFEGTFRDTIIYSRLQNYKNNL